MNPEPDLHQRRNMAVRFELVDRLDEIGENAVRGLLRRAGLPHLFPEMIRPTLLNGSALLGLAVQDRPWPPWGIGSHKVRALILVCPVGGTRAGLSTVFVAPEDATNVGLMTSLFKETLEQLRRRGVERVHYNVAEGSAMAGRVLKSCGFRPADALTLSEHARYRLHEASVSDVLSQLGLADAYTPHLLAHQIDDATFDRNALFHAMNTLASQSFWHELQGIAEIVAQFAHPVADVPPAGAPGGTRGPRPEDVPPAGAPGGTRGPRPEDLPPGGVPGGTRGPRPEDLPPGGVPGGTRGPRPEDLPPGGVPGGTRGPKPEDLPPGGVPGGTRGPKPEDLPPGGVPGGTRGPKRY